MARRSTRPPADSRWKYILLLESGGAFFGDTLWSVLKQIFGARVRRGREWNL